MNRCPITYEECGSARYSPAGLKQISPRLTELLDFPYTAEEQRAESVSRAAKMSIQGIQPKVSVIIDIAQKQFKIVDQGGIYIIKPQSHLYQELPQNEDLTMRLAAAAGIEIPFHGLLYSRDGSLSYFIKRFDRQGRNQKIPVEDFAQLAGRTRETKYDYSMEGIAKLIEKFCTFPELEKSRLWRLTLFSFLTGNEDMHLKNFSLITHSDKHMLSPAYDLLNSTIALKNPQEELALPIGGKKRNLNQQLLVDYYGRERLGLNDKIIEKILAEIKKAYPQWLDLLGRSFLSPIMRDNYQEVLQKRFKVLFN